MLGCLRGIELLVRGQEMLKRHQPVKLYEWGQGTNTVNQVWNQIAEGSLDGARRRSDGVTEVTVSVSGAFKKSNPNDDSIKIVQKNSNVTPASDAWGEAAIGRLVSADGSVVKLEVHTATKVR